MLKVLSESEAKELLNLCKLGRLFEVQKWIEAGKSLSVPAEAKTTPLGVALGNGFYSLVELLVQNDASQESKNRALWIALSTKRLDLIDLLVTNGADIKSVPFIDVLMLWDPKIIRYFLDHGADFITGDPFATAFAGRIRTALRVWRECKESHPEFAAPLQEQADRALRYFCFEEDLKWVSLVNWAGADPRSIGPKWGDEVDLNPADYTSALECAAYSKNVKILKQLKPDANRDDLSHLLSCAASFNAVDSVEYLLGLGAEPNDQPNGGSSALSQCLCSGLRYRGRYDYHVYGSRVKAPTFAVSKTLDIVRALLKHGARWRPDNSAEIRWLRGHLYECEPDVTLELVKQLVKHSACSRETIELLLRKPAMKDHLMPVAPQLTRMKFDVFTAKQKAEVIRKEKIQRQHAVSKLASRYDREKIFNEIWSEAMQVVAKRYKLSDVGLAKVCKKLKIPRPGRGYWAKKVAGKHVPKRPRLPALS
jgi:hypothetical protein